MAQLTRPRNIRSVSAEEQAAALKRMIAENKRRLASSRLLNAEISEKQQSRKSQENRDHQNGR